jgi:hypothetical protein
MPDKMTANVIIGFKCPPDAGAVAYTNVAMRKMLEMPIYAPTCTVP